jgi:hypothetical protein
MSRVLGAFGLLDFTMLRPFSFGSRFETYEPFSGRGKLRITANADTESVDTGARLYMYMCVCVCVCVCERYSLFCYCVHVVGVMEYIALL